MHENTVEVWRRSGDLTAPVKTNSLMYATATNNMNSALFGRSNKLMLYNKMAFQLLRRFKKSKFFRRCSDVEQCGGIYTSNSNLLENMWLILTSLRPQLLSHFK